uniref:Uncharacterized protein n=1 Tax=Streptomyces rochei TaxID=1928 RepID=F2Z8X4_STRRO|nr:hypothetical protein [Streptomyces rochei]
MPTFETCPRFTADLQHLTPAQRQPFRRVVLDAFVPDLRTGRQFRPGLRKACAARRASMSSPGHRTAARRGPTAGRWSPGSPTSCGTGSGPTASWAGP